MDRRAVTVLGSTGSVGVSTLDVIARHPDRYRVFALTANANVALLAEQCARFRPDYAVVADTDRVGAAKEHITGTRVLGGAEALARVAADARCDTVLAAIAGSIGLAPTLAAVRAGKRVLLANKEALIMAGPVFMRAVDESEAELLPVDSEHNGVFQCLGQHPCRADAVEKIVLTASGGPFLDAPRESLAAVTPEQACAHPNWDMGAKISVDSATLMNKGLEVIEACLLFKLAPARVEAVIHPQSLLHALVVFKDGSVVAQMGQPDMRIPIACALAWPGRIGSGVGTLDLARCNALELRAIDEDRFPCFRLAYQALRAGHAAVIALNAANEIAAGEFLAGRLRFDRIPELVRETLEAAEKAGGTRAIDSLETVIEVDSAARELARTIARLKVV